MTAYRYLDHTADLGLEVTSATLTDLFIDTGRAIFETQIADPVTADREINFELSADSLEDLFLDWCRELLYNFSVRGFVPQNYELTFKDLTLKAKVRGGLFDPQKNKVKLEIKNPTYHKLKIEKLPDAYRATIILDV
jgi:SHS2 domain-containing protein